MFSSVTFALRYSRAEKQRKETANNRPKTIRPLFSSAPLLLYLRVVRRVLPLVIENSKLYTLRRRQNSKGQKHQIKSHGRSWNAPDPVSGGRLTSATFAPNLQIPDDLVERDQWVLWRREQVNWRDTKVPYAIRGHRANSTNPRD